MGAEKLPHNSTEYLHLLIEAMRLAFADARYYITDPDFESSAVPDAVYAGLLSEEYAAQASPVQLIEP
jgi:gamma-glutamyltranspeptidase/glutathione hydrolase